MITQADAKQHGVVGPKALKYKPRRPYQKFSMSRPKVGKVAAGVVRGRLEKNIAPIKTGYGRDAAGKIAAPGWMVSATDGHRALVVKGEGQGTIGMSLAPKRDYRLVVESDFAERLLEVSHMAERSNLVVFEFDSIDHKLRLKASLANVGEAEALVDSAHFERPAAQTFRIGLNWKYVKDVLGCWPLEIGWNDAEHYLVFRPRQGSLDKSEEWYYVVMPMRV